MGTNVIFELKQILSLILAVSEYSQQSSLRRLWAPRPPTGIEPQKQGRISVVTLLNAKGARVDFFCPNCNYRRDSWTWLIWL